MNNSQAIGYMIMAAKSLGMDDKTVKELESEMAYQMDMHAEEEAEQVYMQYL